VDLKHMIGARIKGVRIRQGLTQEYVSEQIDINPKYLSSIGRGKENPTLNILIKLAQSLDVNVDEFFRLVEIEDPAKRKSFQDEVLKILDEFEPGTRERAIERLKDRALLRGAVNID